MRRLTINLCAVSLLISCSVPPADVPPVSYRDQDAPIASQVNITNSKLTGLWGVVERVGAAPAIGGRVLIQRADQGLLIETDAGVSQLLADGPGRWQIPPGQALERGPFWVLWMDADLKTAVIGRPDGAFGWIMNRNFAQNPDRVTAGRDILVWFGYDIRDSER